MRELGFHVLACGKALLLTSGPCRQGCRHSWCVCVCGGADREGRVPDPRVPHKVKATRDWDVWDCRKIQETNPIQSGRGGQHFWRGCWVVLLLNPRRGKRARGRPGELGVEPRAAAIPVCFLGFSLCTTPQCHLPSRLLSHTEPTWLLTAHPSPRYRMLPGFQFETF